MQGWLVVNSFLDTSKFRTLYELLAHSAQKKQISLQCKTTAELSYLYEAAPSLENLPSFVLFWDKDIYLAKRLEQLGLRLFNSAAAVELCDNKALTFLSLQSAGIPMPKTILAPKTFEGIGYKDFSFLKAAADTLHFPMVIKEVYGSFGQQVFLAQTLSQAKDIIQSIGSKELLMQSFVPSSRGRDLRIHVVNGVPVASMLRENKTDFRSNISNGGSMYPYTPSPAQEKIAVDACAALGLDFAGVDVLFNEDDVPLICEVNSNPHFKSTLDCTGINLADSIFAHVERSLCGG